MRRLLVIGLVGLCSLFGWAGAASAQDAPTVGDTGAASGDFEATDGACGFGNFTDGTYTATLGQDADGVFIEFTQGSTGDSGRFRSDGDGNVRFETDGDEEYVDIEVRGDELFTVYRYTSGDCTQEWIATVVLPAGFIDAMISANRAPEPEPETSEPTPEDSSPSLSSPSSPPPSPSPSPDPSVSEPSEPSGPSGPASTSGDDGTDWALFGFLGLLVLFLMALFLLWRRRNQRLYRFDRGEFGEIIPNKPEPEPEPEPTPTPDTGSSGPPGIIVEEDDDPAPDAPPPQGDCVPEREEFEMAQEAKDAAFAAGEQADREFVHARDEHGRILATTNNPLGQNPPQPEIDPNASESEQARQQRVHELNLAQWQELEDEASAAKAQLAGAEAVLDKARADRDEAWQDFQRMRRRLEAARVALNNCDGSAGPADGDDQPPAPADSPAGPETGNGPPGVIADPPPEPASEPDEEDDGCTEGETKDGRVVSSTDFRVLGAGSIEVQVGTSAWARHGRAFSAGGFADLDTSTVEELSAGIEQEREAVRISVRIPVDIVTVECVQVLECDGEKFVDSGRTRKVVTRTKGPRISVLPTGAAGGVAKSKDRRDAGRMVEKAQAQVEALIENQESADECECD